MRNILFVDDEEAVLDGLQDSLRTHRRRWNMNFALGGEAAMSQLAEGTFDVIVSDVRMPGVDGVDVLQYAKDHHPKTIRIALTGYSDDANTIKLTKLAQRYLTKPCSVADLDDAICRDSGLVEAFDLPVVQELAGSAGRLPIGDSVQQQLMRCLNTDDNSLESLADIIEKEPALTAKVLQLANSAFFRRQSSVTSARHAVSYLGFDVMRSLLLADQLFNTPSDCHTPNRLDIEALSEHSNLCSIIAKAITPENDPMPTAMTAGLLHDVGKIVIARSRPELLPQLLMVSDEGTKTWVDTERERDILGCSHAEVGGYFLNLWGIPTDIVEAVTFHDDPGKIFTKDLDAIGIVHISNYLAHWVRSGSDKEDVEKKLDTDYIFRWDAMEKVDDWRQLAFDIFHNDSASMN